MLRSTALGLLLSLIALPLVADVNTDLRAAIDRREVARVRELLRAGAAVDSADGSGRTPLMLAARAGSPELVRLMLASRAQIDAVDTAGWTALMYAAVNGNRGIVDDLLGAGANARARDSLGKTAEDLAAQNGHSAVVAAMRQRREGDDSRAVDRLRDRFDGLPPEELDRLIEDGTPELRGRILEAAFVHERTDVVRRLLGRGDRFELDSPRRIGLAVIPPVAWYALKGDTQTLGLLLQRGAAAGAVYRGGTWSNPGGEEERDRQGLRFRTDEEREISRAYRDKTALTLAVEGGYADAVDLLISSGAAVSSDTLAAAVRARQAAVARLLIQRGVALDARFIISAVDTQNIEFVDRIAAGTPAAGQVGEALVQAVAGGNLAAARALSSSRLASRSQHTAAFLRAVDAGYLNLAELIRKQGIDAAALEEAVILAVSRANSDAVRYLLASSAPANARAAGRREQPTALMLAARLLDVDTVAVLVDAGADVAAVDTAGNDARWYAQQGARAGSGERDGLKVANKLQAALDR